MPIIGVTFLVKNKTMIMETSSLGITVLAISLLLLLKPLSHQSNVLTASKKKCRTPSCAHYERKHHRSNAVASPVDVGLHRTPINGTHFEHTQNKRRCSAFEEERSVKAVKAL